ncbi:phosphodiester glycosidase family protein [Clostridium tarantellae]|uniref:Exopolysaccharide biosynthesis protein n=1 Tax=Clostridium tarantellae TaxID=39493 RepID=A0A6I1MWB6_9CLOT|nr:phosphodiester glycosidase family protein [Clostridium tarantellae]MPQ45111.1 exopolysaccharide biosynthesis protein [Clostridium tarantellae]
MTKKSCEFKNNKHKKNNKKNKGYNKKLKSRKWKVFSLFVIFQIAFGIITAPFIIYYGPFNNIKTSLVGAAMTSLNHQYLATAFLSNEKIKEILSQNKVEDIKQDTKNSKITLPKKHNDKIELFEVKGKKFNGYMLVVSDPTRVKIGYTSKLNKEGQTTSQIAKQSNAIAAINGGGFTDKSATSTWTGNGGTPIGVIMTNGKKIFNSLKDDEKTDMMAITDEGRLLVGKYSYDNLKNLNAKEALSFGPPLVVNGQPTITTGDGGAGIASRTAIGQREDGAMLLLVVDGRSINSIGATWKEIQDVMIQYGAINAINLDGGNSTTMYYNDEIVNNPSDHLGERSIPSVVMVK